jgi:predicted nucleic acid-binding protein
MNELFVDTSAFYALADSADRHHRPARAFLKAWPKQGRALVTSTDVFDETVTLLRYRLGHDVAVAFGEKLTASKWCRVVEATEAVRRSAWDIFVRYADQSFSLTDCTSFAIMRSMHVTQAFTFDRRDFGAAGFVATPE